MSDGKRVHTPYPALTAYYHTAAMAAEYEAALYRARGAGVEDEARRLALETPLTLPQAVDLAITRALLRPCVAATTRLVEQMKPLLELTGFLPPPPKTESGMTARQYRAARRRWARNRKATS